MKKVILSINGVTKKVFVDAGTRLLNTLQGDLGLTTIKPEFMTFIPGAILVHLF
jgi:aerobic-type carbon monoxide dehydrogenase small subunit (CoxS/CutS family)